MSRTPIRDSRFNQPSEALELVLARGENVALGHVPSHGRAGRRVWPISPAIDIICTLQENLDPVASKLRRTDSCETIQSLLD